MLRRHLLVLLVEHATALRLSTGAAAGVAGFLGWAFQGIGPSPEAKATIAEFPWLNPTRATGVSGLLLGGSTPKLAFYAGAKVRPASYAPLVAAYLRELEDPEAGVILLQSPACVYAFKPPSVAKVLECYPSVSCIAGHNLGGFRAAESCRALHESGGWPEAGLSFYYMGVHGKGVSLAPFKALPFERVGWAAATQDVTLRRAAAGAGSQGVYADDVAAYIKQVAAHELPEGAQILEIEGGNHEQYGSYGSPGFLRGLAYQDLPAVMPAEMQRDYVAAALAAVSR